MQDTRSGEFIRSARDEPGPRDWILDIYGSFVRDAGGWIAVAHLLAFLNSLGFSASSGRSALSRMKRRGEIEACTVDGQRGYRLTEQAEQWFADGTPRILGRPPGEVEESWVLASFSVPESDRSLRYRIRARLEALGFGSVAGGLLIAPGHLMNESMRALQRGGLTDRVHLWHAEYTGFEDPAELVSTAWNLDLIQSAYDEYGTFADELTARPPARDDAEAFVRFLENVQAWRELPFIDPEIPLRYLPAGWPRDAARARFDALAGQFRPGATRHFIETIVPNESATASAGHSRGESY